ncbi:MAG: hypothetical protein R3E02_12760 [Blastomonas sp.]
MLLKIRYLAFVQFMVMVFAANSPALATTFFEQKFVCPIGGEKFKASVVGSNSTFGQRPDGKPYSPMAVIRYTECPSNGFPIFQKDFTARDIAILTPIIASDEYQQMRTAETQRFRVWYLKKAIGASAADQASALMVAGWEADGDAALKARYQEAFVDAVAAIIREDDPETWFWLNLRAANALRELGRFDDALHRFGEIAPYISSVVEDDQRSDIEAYLDDLTTLVKEGNSASEPVGLVPPRYGAVRCVMKQMELSQSEKNICDTEEMMASISRFSVDTDDGQLTGAEAIKYLESRYRDHSE